MNNPDTLERLEGEPQIPSLTPRGGASSHKPVIAVSVLMLSLVGVLGFAATRYFGKKEAPPEAAVDVASATVMKSPGMTTPRVGCRQRTNASTPAVLLITAPSRSPTTG